MTTNKRIDTRRVTREFAPEIPLRSRPTTHADEVADWGYRHQWAIRSALMLHAGLPVGSNFDVFVVGEVVAYIVDDGEELSLDDSICTEPDVIVHIQFAGQEVTSFSVDLRKIILSYEHREIGLMQYWDADYVDHYVD